MPTVPDVVLITKPVDNGTVIGIIECPNCGETHFTVDLRCGGRLVFCNVANRPGIRPDGYSAINVTRVLS